MQKRTGTWRGDGDTNKEDTITKEAGDTNYVIRSFIRINREQKKPGLALIFQSGPPSKYTQKIAFFY